ncbi:hypothetical protein BU204_18720 [Actinophytocola xanthii]|uniref:Adenylosuccinate lyase C-terminal domain-containing protein n=1 Tax=Actinophytocola xanthii TaxID=1912961 RepID=A0A1Q8CNL8_9PSEU|nr:hypothetical protein BU204_18720 [Actinophytocola xanthii]
MDGYPRFDFDDVSPLDYRYYKGIRGVYDRARPYASESAHIRYQLKVEVALARALAKAGLCTAEVADEIAAACHEVTPEEVYLEELRTKHHVRALVNCVGRRVSEPARPWVHLLLTSSDVTDTAAALRLRDLTIEVLLPDLLDLARLLIDWARATAELPQVGRTHGQFAVPVTFGFTVAGYVHRLGNRIEAVERAAHCLKGKASGAVGAYNAHTLLGDRTTFSPEELEQAVLGELGIAPAAHATQIVPPEYAGDLAWAVTSCFSVLANIADDVRHLMRSEIGELGTAPDATEVGSSTMPHKTNPFRFEMVKSLWKSFAPRLVTTLLDQVSEHQRDLTNGASARFAVELFVAFSCATTVLTRALAAVRVNPARMRRHLDAAGEQVTTEALYVLLALSGHADAYDLVHAAVRRAQSSGEALSGVLRADDRLASSLGGLSDVLVHPESYTGLAAERTEYVCGLWERRLLGSDGMAARLARGNRPRAAEVTP